MGKSMTKPLPKRSRRPLVRPAGTSSRSSEYLATLEAGWQEHLAPRAHNAPTVISTFAGCGGSSLDYSMAGFRELLAVEWDDHAVECFRLNFPDVPVYHGDIAALSVEECCDLAGVVPGELDVLDGSPPCQGFSTAGRRQLDDPRNQLFQEFVRLLDGLRPKAFVMENVSGMVKGKMKLVFAEALRALRGCGYQVSARLLDAANYGVPQHRKRMIFIGVREDLGIPPSHPRGSSRWLTLAAAIGDLSEMTEPPPLNDTYGRLWTQVPVGGSAANVIGTGYNSCRKVHPNQPCGTITKMQTGRGYATLVHWSQPRALTLEEAKRICSFPDTFQLRGDYAQAWGLMGNSVPPLFMKAIAETIRQDVLSHGNQTDRGSTQAQARPSAAR